MHALLASPDRPVELVNRLTKHLLLLATDRDIELNERQRKVLNRMLDGFEGVMNNRKYMAIAKTSRATATRELAALVELGLFAPVGEGRSRSYRLQSAP
jgi:Fic family protein